MNCECIYYHKDATIEDYKELAEKIKSVAKIACEELYPTAISRMEEKVTVCEDYNGWGKEINIPKNRSVLFVGGKLHHMIPFRVGRRMFKPWNPMEEPIFTDLETYDEEE